MIRFSIFLISVFISEIIPGSFTYHFLERSEGYRGQASLALYYECFCPGCKQLETTEFKTVVTQLGSYLNVNVYPYGNAKTNIDPNGEVTFECQHGPDECYGNKIHACAIDYFGNITRAILFNSCLMDSDNSDNGSNDAATQKCGQAQNVDTTDILQCAKGDKGTQLLQQYGEETAKTSLQYVPWVILDGNHWQGDDLKKDVCKILNNEPPPCY